MKNEAVTPHDHSTSSTDLAGHTVNDPSFSRAKRAFLSVLILIHLWAILAPPLAFQTQGPLGSSPSVRTMLEPVRRYGEVLYLNRGYAFFAPDPGPSHLLQIQYVDASGKRVERRYPDRDQQWPRLLYHRHFMLTEFLHDVYQPPGPPQELIQLAPVEARQWAGARARYEFLRKSYADHLQHRYASNSAPGMLRLEHRIPSFIEFIEQPLALTDDRFYGVLEDRPLEIDSDNVPREPEVIPADGVPEPESDDSSESNIQTLPRQASE